MLNSPQSSDGCNEPDSTGIDVLKEKISRIDKEIDELGIEYSEDELQIHIDKLHEYNEIKDMGQLLLGKIGKGKVYKWLPTSNNVLVTWQPCIKEFQLETRLHSCANTG